MKIEVIKAAGGILLPASDMEAEKLTKLKSGEQYQVEIKQVRNPQFHRKVFSFFNFCFQHWAGDDFQSDQRQFDVFRNHLTCLAGFYVTYHNINAGVRVEAKSLAYANMTQEEFEQCYTALINAAIKHIFKDADEQTINQLQGFF